MFLKLVPVLFLLFAVVVWFVWNKFFKKPAAVVVPNKSAAPATGSGSSSGNVTAPTPVVTPAPAASAYVLDADLFVSIDQFPEVKNATAIANKRVCTTLVKSQLTPAQLAGAAWYGVAENCRETTVSIAESITFANDIFHRTAYGVTTTAGKFALNGQPNGINNSSPDSVQTRADLVAYLNSLSLPVEQFPQAVFASAPGAALAALAARKAAAGK